MLELSQENVVGTVEKQVKDTHRENCVLLISVKEFIEIETWLLLTFFQCLHNQLISIIPLTYIKEDRRLKNVNY